MVHYLFHSHKFKVDQHAADRVVRFSVVIAGVNTVAQSGIGDNTVGDKSGMVFAVQGLIAAECEPPASEIREFLIFDYGFVLEMAEIEDTGLAAVHAHLKRGGADLQVPNLRTILMERRQIGNPLTKITSINNADAGGPQTGLYIGERPHAPGSEVIAGIRADQFIRCHLESPEADVLNLLSHTSSTSSVVLT